MKMPAASAAARKRLEELVGDDPRVQLRKMFGQPAAFVNGNLCAGAYGSDFFVRLGTADVATLSRLAGVRPFEPMPGRPMKQYLILPPTLLKESDQAKKWVSRSIEYVLSLPPK